MRVSSFLPEVCHRTRQHVSIRLDSTLSELEEALATAHLARCAACSEFASDLEGFTETLRTAPLAEPSMPFELPRRPSRFSAARASSAAVAAITVTVALSGITLSGVVGIDPAPARISASDVESAHDRMLLKEQLMREIDTANVPLKKGVPRGFEAAKDATVNATGSSR
ncbi:MAG: zf-HC2 domain-containing protein [Gaiellaceae bacterium]